MNNDQVLVVELLIAYYNEILGAKEKLSEAQDNLKYAWKKEIGPDWYKHKVPEIVIVETGGKAYRIIHDPLADYPPIIERIHGEFVRI